MNDTMPLARALERAGLGETANELARLALATHAAETTSRTHIVRAYRDLRSLKHERMPAPLEVEHAAARLLLCALKLKMGADVR
jgi:hypothetical protein